MMMLTFHMSGHCDKCGEAVQGTKIAWPERVNLGCIVVKQSVTFWKKDCQPVPRRGTAMTSGAA
jgi:hypothetical protein